MTDRPEGTVCRQRSPDPGLKRALADEEAFASFLPLSRLGQCVHSWVLSVPCPRRGQAVGWEAEAWNESRWKGKAVPPCR